MKLIIEHSVRGLIRLLLLGALTFTGELFAAGSTIEGVVKGPDGRPISGADIRIEARNNNSARLIKTDKSGHYFFDGLAAGVTYRVTLLIHHAAKASINNVVATTGPTELNFDLQTTSVAGNRLVTKKGKHYVYIPSETGSHLGGRWVEVDENGHADTVGVNNVEKASPEALRRMQSNSGAVGNMMGQGH